MWRLIFEHILKLVGTNRLPALSALCQCSPLILKIVFTTRACCRLNCALLAGATSTVWKWYLYRRQCFVLPADVLDGLILILFITDICLVLLLTWKKNPKQQKKLNWNELIWRLLCLSLSLQKSRMGFFFAFVHELWLLLVTTDLDLSKPELSTLCLASVEAESSLLWGTIQPWCLFTSSGS